MSSRIGLIATGLAFGLWEAVDIFWIDVPAIAAVFAGLFLGCTLWFWRRDSARAAAGADRSVRLRGRSRPVAET